MNDHASPDGQPIWTPSPARVAASNMTAFRLRVESRHGVDLPDYAALHAWSVANPDAFWSDLWTFCGIIGEPGGAPVITDRQAMPGAQFFPEARLNFAENLLRRRDEAAALICRGEDKVRRSVSYEELYDTVARLARALKAAGVGPGDRVAGYFANVPEAIMAMLATASLGAIWSSASPDFGTQGVLDRFGQIEPKVLFAVDGYFYGGKTFDILPKVAEVAVALPTVTRTVIVGYTRDDPPTAGIRDAVAWNDFLDGPPGSGGDIAFAHLPFNHPLYIMFSSGTTGVPKCIVHGAGGTLIQHLKEHVLHCDVKPGDRVFYFTTLGWMMWNWMVSALASEAGLVLYDGNPFHPDGNGLWDLAEEAGITLFGTSAKYIDALHKQGYKPGERHPLERLRLITSTGSPLVPESYDYVYADIKAEVQLASISGGTDIVSCFALGNPVLPVWRGELQCLGLGMDVQVFDADGHPVTAEKGELVCTQPFPAMPIGFWNDPDGAKYHDAYFARFEGIWCHGDYVERTRHGGMIIYGRSDATLNPGGVRIGTAEIYRQVEKLPEVTESLVIGQSWEDDVRVVLFVTLAAGADLTEDLVRRIKTQIRTGASPRHVPAKVVAVADIPRTKSGKITELAVRDVVHGRPVKNKEALANPDALALYADLPELQR